MGIGERRERRPERVIVNSRTAGGGDGEREAEGDGGGGGGHFVAASRNVDETSSDFKDSTRRVLTELFHDAVDVVSFRRGRSVALTVLDPVSRGQLIHVFLVRGGSAGVSARRRRNLGAGNRASWGLKFYVVLRCLLFSP